MDILDLRRKIQIKIDVKEKMIIEAAKNKSIPGLESLQKDIDKYLAQIQVLQEILKEIDEGIQKMIDAVEKEKV